MFSRNVSTCFCAGRRVLTFVSVLLTIIGFTLLMASCSQELHVHTYSETWTYDEAYHWHATTCEHTDQVSDKATHTWDEGVVFKKATHTEDGVRLYTCTVCGNIKTEQQMVGCE